MNQLTLTQEQIASGLRISTCLGCEQKFITGTDKHGEPESDYCCVTCRDEYDERLYGQQQTSRPPTSS
jgi:hypothetical protein